MNLTDKQNKLLRKRAKEIMRQISGDFAHDVMHIERTLKIARKIYKSLNFKADWNLVEQAILWHDISRSNNRGTGIFMYFFDDLLSVRQIKREFTQLGIAKKATRKVCKVVLQERFYGRSNSVEGKILKDADSLDTYSIGRYKRIFKKLKTGWFSKKKGLFQTISKIVINFYVLMCVWFYHSRIYGSLDFEESRKIYKKEISHLAEFFDKNHHLSDFVLYGFTKNKLFKALSKHRAFIPR